MRVRLLVKVMKPDLVTVKARVVGNTSCTVTTARPLPSVTAHCSNSNVKASVSSSIGTPSKLDRRTDQSLSVALSVGSAVEW